MGKTIEQIRIGKTRWNLRAYSSHHRFGPNPLITIPARGLWTCRTHEALKKFALDHTPMRLETSCTTGGNQRRFHVVWVTRYRYKVLLGAMRERNREIIIQTCNEKGVHIVKGMLAHDHVHMFLSIPPKLSLSDVMQRIKGGSSRRIQMGFPELRKRYWGRPFWARGYFSTTSGNVTDDIIKQYLKLHCSN